MALGQLILDLLERPAELAQSILRYADAVVGDDDGHLAAAPPPAHRHCAAIRGELHGVGEKIERDLLQRAPIGIELDVEIDFCVKLESLFTCPR